MIIKKLNRISLFLFVACLNLYSQAAELKPFGLLTDLVEHTDRVWINGFLSNISIWETEDVIEPFEFVKICSSYPSFSWIVPGEKQNVRQTAYLIIIRRQFQETGQSGIADKLIVDNQPRFCIEDLLYEKINFIFGESKLLQIQMVRVTGLM